MAGAVRLGRRDHAAARCGRPQRVLAPRPHPGRQLVDQRHVYIRGNRVDYDAWRDRYGCAGWGYADLLPYFRRAEDQQRGESPFHGVGGPLRVEDPRYLHPLSQAWVEAATAAGLAANPDFNGPTQDGVGL